MEVRPILFNGEMVQAIDLGLKTQTRRLVQEIPLYEPYFEDYDGKPMACDENGCWYPAERFSRIQPGDILYVRETWTEMFFPDGESTVLYAAIEKDYNTVITTPLHDGDGFDTGKPFPWRPSIHMPKKYARTFLQVSNVRMERLQQIDIDGIRAEGLTSAAVHCGDMEIAIKEWTLLWDSTIKKADIRRFGWEANPWVWVYEFERTTKPKGWG